MLLNLIRKEIVSHVLSLRFGVTFILSLLLIFASIFITVNKYKLKKEDYDKNVQLKQAQIDQILAEQNPDSQAYLFFNYFGTTDAVPNSPYSWLGLGYQGEYPDMIKTLSGMRSEDINRNVNQTPFLSLMQTPDFFYVVNIMLSLLAIFFMFDSICGEKESGTLRLILSNPVPRHDVLLSKWIGGFIVLSLPFLISIAGGLVYATYMHVITWDLESIQRLAMLLLAAGLYISVFFNLSLFISTTTHRSATSLLICLLLWVLCIIVVPSLAPVTGQVLARVPPKKMIDEAKEAVDNEVRTKKWRIDRIYGKLAYGSDAELEKEQLEQDGNHQKQRLDKLYSSKLERQRMMINTISRLSPSACWVYAATTLTNSGYASYNNFQIARDRLAGQFDDYFKEYQQSRRGQRRSNPGEAFMLSEDKIPALKVMQPGLNQSVNDALNDMLILTILNVIFFMLAFTFFLRYDVR
ncbi:MAG: ABC transporter permease subunit [Planctomycetes bacterium]|nr:ABC transporter permease subunit [Planctomycetota bacterium]